ncbi:hypothetical protein BCR33DRAFT_789886 [Rhizoclosmatium globosum]|uniref:Uncharacterized protein n=1 Tax=Rhizoclosmatium globosum TaxID=329046 RepID=A0A1Y2BQI9_9FUNG|nr:hypothetical protein BCR33DRAFT_789886 [Rhizoclosmatium globosum]|eukprot:ORY37010.1 hypothetical protein BCR33DRAFT_789886 [Rhizoclosmatium globosum]
MHTPGIEPGFARPQRAVLTVIREIIFPYEGFNILLAVIGCAAVAVSAQNASGTKTNHTKRTRSTITTVSTAVPTTTTAVTTAYLAPTVASPAPTYAATTPAPVPTSTSKPKLLYSGRSISPTSSSPKTTLLKMQFISLVAIFAAAVSAQYGDVAASATSAAPAASASVYGGDYSAPQTALYSGASSAAIGAAVAVAAVFIVGVGTVISVERCLHCCVLGPTISVTTTTLAGSTMEDGQGQGPVGKDM